jgi:ABC-2 type transport system ATP-binding protein
MIEVNGLTKRYGDVTAVDDISFVVKPGVVTGFLGPNGAGKSTTMRMILGLDHPTSGTATINGRRYAEAPAPLAEMGALLEARAIDKGRSARNHLLALGAVIGVGASRVDDLLDLVGLTEVGRQPAGNFSLGMGQRLGIASALLGDPATVMLDEPVNGLDPDGIRWMRGLLKELASEGRTVFLSSHLMSEMELTADHLIVIGQGRIISDVSMADFIANAATDKVRVTSPDAAYLQSLLAGPGVTTSSQTLGTIVVQGVPASTVGEVAAAAGVVLHELVNIAPSLEEAFMELTRDQVQFRGSADSTTANPTREAA